MDLQQPVDHHEARRVKEELDITKDELKSLREMIAKLVEQIRAALHNQKQAEDVIQKHEKTIVELREKLKVCTAAAALTSW
jgi:predicted  nucleic acid-binding Zn-ribbon protein